MMTKKTTLTRTLFPAITLVVVTSFIPPAHAMNDPLPHPPKHSKVSDHYFLYSCSRGNEHECRTALANDANVAARDEKGRTPLHLIARCKNIFAIKNIIPLLIEHKADPEARDNYGYTALDLVKNVSELPFEQNPIVQILSKYSKKRSDDAELWDGHKAQPSLFAANDGDF